MSAVPMQKPGRSKQDYGTPWDFIRAVERRFGDLHMDLAATAENKKADYFIGPDEDSLKAIWPRFGNLWLNPPFADIGPWAAKCAQQATRERTGFIFLLVPASIGTDWFAKHVAGKAYVEGISPRLTFEGCEDPYPKDLMLAIYGYGLHGFATWRWDR